MTDVVERLDLRSQDIAEEKREEILRLYPETSTEGGKIDFERLKQTLGEMVDVGKERYGMNWPGKADCFKTIQAPSMGTLLPFPEESLNFDTTENLIIEGDNLEVLKLLQKSYLGKVKMIYIDPPYNTGNDFIYPDDYTESLQTYLEYTGQVDAEGKKFGTNTETDGRFHSKWLSMMYPRLYLARNLLREDGVIFISIDDTEFDNLSRVCKEIFGEDNFIETLIWKRRATPPNDRIIGRNHEYIIAYAKNIDALGLNLQPRSEKDNEGYVNPDNDPRGPHRLSDLSANGKGGRLVESCIFPIVDQDGKEHLPPKNKCWLYNKNKVAFLIKEGRIGFRKGTGSPYLKRYLDEVRNGITLPTILTDIGTSQDSASEIRKLFGDDVYEFPKPTNLMIKLLVCGAENDGIVLDFFAGSGTTAHAILNLNTQDGGNRRFILVQLPEPTCRRDYPIIAEITKERVRRVIQKLNEGDTGKLDLEGKRKQDRGFRVFKLTESSFKPWNAQVEHDASALEQQLELHVGHIRDGRTAADILYEILLKSGFSITTPMETLTLTSMTVYSIASGALLICLERELTLELIRMMADRKPERIVCLDEGFAGNDQLKANAVQIFKAKGVTSFKTV